MAGATRSNRTNAIPESDIEWTAIRVADGRAVDGRGAYHCRVADGLVHEDWDVFSPMP